MKRWANRWLWTAAGALLVLPALALVMLLAALQGEPAVAVQPAIKPYDVARVWNLLKVHDPRRAPAGQVRAVTLSDHEVDLLLSHGAQRWLGGASRATIARGSAELVLSLHTLQLAQRLGLGPWVATGPLGRWLNLQVRLEETGALPALASVHIGRLPVPVGLAQWAGLRFIHQVGLGDELPLAVEVLRRVKFMPGELQLVYVWHGDTTQRVLSALLPGEEQRRLQVYADAVVGLASRYRGGWDISLAQLIGPVFVLARERTAQGQDAALENRAAIVVLTLFANGRGVGDVLPSARDWPRARPLRVLLGGRDDWPRHFLVSAALASEGTGPMSQAIGLYKEIADSQGGSGFSFNDMAANRAGTRMGERAVQDPRRLQDFLGSGHALDESDFMPQAADLPEYLPEPEFLRRFGGVGAPAYQQLMNEIERRVALLPVLR